MEVRVTIPGEPVAQGRGRVAVVNGRPRVYDPAKSRSWKGAAQVLMAAEMSRAGLKPFSGPVDLTVIAYWQLPKSSERKKPVPVSWRPKRPDASNVLKAVEDAANSVLFLDDAQIVSAIVQKMTATQGEAARVEIHVEEVGE